MAPAAGCLLARPVTCVVVHRGESLLHYRINFSALFGNRKRIPESGQQNVRVARGFRVSSFTQTTGRAYFLNTHRTFPPSPFQRSKEAALP